MKSDYCIKMLREANLKVTPKRKAIIKFFLQDRRCFTPEEVWTALKGKFEHLGFPTIYRNLKELENIGILTRISQPSQKFHYALCPRGQRVGFDHHICEKCGRVSEVELCNFKDIAKDIEKKLNCKITSHFIQIRGLCSKCK